jgi:protein SCO1/2
MNRRYVIFLFTGLVVIALGLLAFATSRLLARDAFFRSPRHPHELGSLVTQDGKPFSFKHLKGRTVVLNFVFTHCPSSCPLQTKALAEVQRGLPPALRSRVAFVSVSVDPARDTPPVMKQFASTLGADLSNWSFVTGSPVEIEFLNEYFNAQVKPTVAGQFDHRIAVYLLAADYRLIQTYNGEPLDESRLIQEIETVDQLFNHS